MLEALAFPCLDDPVILQYTHLRHSYRQFLGDALIETENKDRDSVLVHRCYRTKSVLSSRD